ncbi:MAG TPA: cupin domain-containing protein [Acidimicrobiia bacterium]|nr:cupin domain-containing protein [Acidimicrobiia bacterium]
MSANVSLDGWDITSAADTEWMPWGSSGKATAKVLGSADGFVVALVRAEPGYTGDAHVHAHPELFYLVDGALRNQGREMVAGDGYGAAAGSSHDEFATDTGATYVVVFRI